MIRKTEEGERRPPWKAGKILEKIACFKAYDVRGRVPEELNEDLAYRIGRAYAAFLSPARWRWAGISAPPASPWPKP